jgi:hypothetical protein
MKESPWGAGLLWTGIFRRRLMGANSVWDDRPRSVVPQGVALWGKVLRRVSACLDLLAC